MSQNVMLGAFLGFGVITLNSSCVENPADTKPKAVVTDPVKQGKASQQNSASVKDTSTHTVSGNLTIKGIKKSISFPATITSNNGFQMTSEFSINRKDFNITYKGKPDDLIRDDVLLQLDFKSGDSAPKTLTDCTGISTDAKGLTGKIIFTGSKVTGNHITEFTSWTGGATDATDLNKAKLQFCVQTNEMIADIDAKNPGNPKFEKKMRSHHFFDVEKFPTATFESTKIVAK